MKLLELFSGTGSIGKVAKNLGWEVMSLDLKKSDIECDILKWDHTQFDEGEFDFIWASPPCTEYSIALSRRQRDIPSANKIVQKTLEIIDYLKPKYYVIENPQTGYLKVQDFMQGRHYIDIDYCKYGMPYRKRTRLWNNILDWKPRALCKKDCGNIINNKHKATAQRGPNKEYPNNRFEQNELYMVPSDLINEISNNII